MSLRLVKAAAETESMDDFHLGRLLVLLRSSDLRRDHARDEGEGRSRASRSWPSSTSCSGIRPVWSGRSRYVNKDPKAAEVQPRESDVDREQDDSLSLRPVGPEIPAVAWAPLGPRARAAPKVQRQHGADRPHRSRAGPGGFVSGRPPL